MGVADVERPRHEVALAVLRSLRARLRGMPAGHPLREATADRVDRLRDEVAGYVEAGLLPRTALEG